MNYLEATTSLPKYGRQQIEELGASTSPAPPSILEAPKLELKKLPQHLRYAFLGENSTYLFSIDFAKGKTYKKRGRGAKLQVF